MTDARPGVRHRVGGTPALALSGAYLALSVPAFLLTGPPGSGTALWAPATGLAFGYLLRMGAPGIPVVALSQVIGTLLTAPALVTPSLAGPGPTTPAVAVPGLVTPLLHTGMPGSLATALATDLGLTVWFALTALGQRSRWRPAPTYRALAWFALFGVVLAPLGAATIRTLSAAAAGLPADGGLWARWLLGDATAVVTLTPAIHLVAAEAFGRVRLAPRLDRRRRLAIVGQAAAIVVMPALSVVTAARQPAEVAALALALAPLCWLTFSRDLSRASVVLAAASVLLGATAQVRFGESLATFRLQSVMFAGGVAALFAGAGLASHAAAARRAAALSTRWRALVEVAPAVVARVDRSGRWNVEPGGPPRADAEALVARAAEVPDLVAAVVGATPATVRWRADDGTRRFVTHVTPLPDGDCLAVTTEATGLYGAEVALAWERSHDRETDLPNRDLLLATADQVTAEGGPASLILVDVERAAWRPEVLQAGPARLVLVLAERLRGLLDPAELAQGRAMVARVGDDQLGVLVPTGPHPARNLAGRMVVALREPVITPRGPLTVTAWAGIAPLEPDRTAGETLRLAATAVHTAIEQRRRPVILVEGLSAATAGERARLAEEVTAAIGRGELDVVFQPDVALPDGRLTGVEALVRWRRPEGYAAATDLFVQLAEETGAVRQVDAWVMEESLRALGAWRRDHPGTEVELALNVSGPSLTEDLPERLFEACLRHDVPPWYVRLEVTESALGDGSAAPEVLRRIRARGCRVALDDFGIGYATLSRLHRLPVDVVKLDRSFLSPITEDVTSQALVSLVLGLAGPLRVEVVVEGVETPQQRDVLVGLGCRRAQGFLFARPCSTEAIDRMLSAGRPLGGPRPSGPRPPAPRSARATAGR